MIEITKKRRFLQALNYGILLGAATWLLLVIRGAQVLKSSAEQTLYQVSFGPLTLLNITRQTTSREFAIGFSFELDIIWYLGVWVIAGSLFGALRIFYTGHIKQA